MKYDPNFREEELKNKVAVDYFSDLDTTRILGNIDFSVSIPNSSSDIEDVEFLIWAESKKGDKSNVCNSLTQLILTIGKEEVNYKYNAPPFLAPFDSQKVFCGIHWPELDTDISFESFTYEDAEKK